MEPGTVVDPSGAVVVEVSPGSVVSVVSGARVVVVVSGTVVVVDWGGVVVVVESPAVVVVDDSPGVGAPGVVVVVDFGGGCTGSGNRVSIVTGAQVLAALASGADDPNPTHVKPRPSAIATRAPNRRSISIRLPNRTDVGNLAEFHYVANA